MPTTRDSLLPSLDGRLIEVADEGINLQLGPADLERLGWDREVTLQVRIRGNELSVAPTLTPEQVVSRRALRYLYLRIGDATAIGAPVQIGDRWEVPVFLSYGHKQQLGKLVFSLDGVLDRDASTDRETMEQAANAA